VPEPSQTSLPSVPIDVGLGPVVLLVHGQPGEGEDWRRLADLLSHDHRVLAPDRPGWGSHPRPAVGIAENATVLARVAERCGAEPPLTVVGHSFGGGIALELALTRPDIVGSLVLVGSVGVEAALSGLDRLLAVPVVGDGIVRAGGAAVRQAFGALRRLPENWTAGRLARKASDLPTVRAVLSGGDGEQLLGRARASFVIEQRALIDETPALERRLSLLQLPVAVAHGRSDHIVPLAAGRLLAERIPGAELVVFPGEGHLLALDRPDEIAALVRRYSRMASLSFGGEGARR
jgi:pimeloyl-ACP methyl ester carboxylesterase